MVTVDVGLQLHLPGRFPADGWLSAVLASLSRYHGAAASNVALDDLEQSSSAAASTPRSGSLQFA